jgi:hypothetical protein
VDLFIFRILFSKPDMKKTMMGILLIAGITFSCTTGKKTATNGSSNVDPKTSQDTVMVKPVADGKSFETAVVIKERTESKGIHAEYVWIGEHYTGYKIVQQSLSNHNKKPYDIIAIEFGDGSTQKIYFDISKYYGHW